MGLEQFSMVNVDDINFFQVAWVNIYSIYKLFNQLSKYELKIKSSKYQFILEEIEYWGFVIRESSQTPK